MPRRRYVWSPEVGALVEVSTNYSQPARETPLIMPDIVAFKSPVDGSVITGRAALREHNKRNNVTNAADFASTWAAQAKQREVFFSGNLSYDRDRRRAAVIDAVNKTSRK